MQLGRRRSGVSRSEWNGASSGAVNVLFSVWFRESNSIIITHRKIFIFISWSARGGIFGDCARVFPGNLIVCSAVGCNKWLYFLCVRPTSATSTAYVTDNLITHIKLQNFLIWKFVSALSIVLLIIESKYDPLQEVDLKRWLRRIRHCWQNPTA
jgi:hypothetical protein